MEQSNHMSNKMIKKKKAFRKGLLIPPREKIMRFKNKNIKHRKRGIYLCLILVTNLTFKKNKERWKCLILRDMDKYLKFRSI